MFQGFVPVVEGSQGRLDAPRFLCSSGGLPGVRHPACELQALITVIGYGCPKTPMPMVHLLILQSIKLERPGKYSAEAFSKIQEFLMGTQK